MITEKQQEFIDYLENILIPDLKISGQINTARDFEKLLKLVDTQSKDQPLWVGIELPTIGGGVTKVCLGLYQEDGHDVAFTSDEDIKASKGKYDPWITTGINLSVCKGKSGKVFDKKHSLIKIKNDAHSVYNDVEE